jgi:8-oxo-dGTP pyrophosphatase MutT (NUDIX family)
MNELTEAIISRRLARALVAPDESIDAEFHLPPEFWETDPRPAAVLVPLLKKDNAWEVLFTRRTASLVEHSGQVAFPGGRVEPGDVSVESAALREAEEEIALQPKDVRRLGRLKQLRTITNYYVTPIVGVIPWPYPYSLALEEVSRVFTIPLSWLADPQNYEIRPRQLPTPHPPARVIYFQLFDGELLWGVSAQITLNLLKALQLI